VRAFDLPSPPWILAHRGASGEAPENTLESFLLAVEQEADIIEIDLWLTRDRQLVAFHDADLKAGLHRKAPVESLTLYRFQRALKKGSGIEAPTLQQILHLIPESRPLNLDLKRRYAEPSAIIAALATVLAERPQVLLSSFDWPLLAEIKLRLPGYPVAPIGDRKPGSLLQAAIELESFSVHCHRKLARREFLLAAAEAGKPPLVYTVNRPFLARNLWSRGAAGVFTDYPGRLRRSLQNSTR
jgi:glycerophosphoryl diester phosphodiesterase